MKVRPEARPVPAERPNDKDQIRLTPVSLALLLLGALVAGAVGGLLAYYSVMVHPTSQPAASAPPTPVRSGNISTAIQNGSPMAVAITAPESNSSARLLLGSGVILDTNGYILTTRSVLRDYDKVDAVFYDGRSAPATIAGVDSGSGLALLKVSLNIAQGPTFGNPSKIQIGDQVIVLGSSSTDLQRTVGQGIVSSTGYSAVTNNSQDTADNLIETDAQAPDGGIGGPLLDTNGNIIGITTSYTKGNTWTLALPINTARDIAQKLIKTGAGPTASLGIWYQTVTPQLAELKKLDQQSGALIIAIAPHSPASVAGLRPDDLIIAMDGKVINDKQTFESLLSAHRPGQKVKLEVVRNSQIINVVAKLSRKPLPNSSFPNQSS